MAMISLIFSDNYFQVVLNFYDSWENPLMHTVQIKETVLMTVF